MKRIFLNQFQLDALAAGGGGAEKPTLESLRAASAEAAKASYEKLMDPATTPTEAVAAQLLALKAAQAVTSFINAEKLALQNAELDKVRTERAAMVDKMIEAYDNSNKVAADKKSTIEDKNTAYHTFTDLRDTVKNELVKGMRAPSAPKVATEGEPKAGRTGNQKEEIQTKYAAYLAGGLTDTQARKELNVKDGYSVGSIWAPVVEYRKTNGLV